MHHRWRRAFYTGNGLFSRTWKPGETSAATGGGLGPLYNASSCRQCHFRDGRGRPPGPPAGESGSLVLQLSVPGADDGAAGTPFVRDPVYGRQLQVHAVAGLSPEGRLGIEYREIPVAFEDGDGASLRAPRYRLEQPAYGAPHPRLMLSPRVAPAMIGLGLLEAIADERLATGADPEDADGDGISGRVNVVWSDSEQAWLPGRFGWKAGKARIADQVALALAVDMGIASPLLRDPWGDCTGFQARCRAGSDAGDGLTDEAFAALVFYSRHLAVPRRRGEHDSRAQRGEALFHASGCAACHTPVQRTRADWPVQGLAGETIRPYTDLLLHDMGEGLADHRPEGGATGREWRTPPLWGIGLTETVSGHSYFLHDGRARGLMEAILWHDGEARASREAVRGMNADERGALLAFLESL